MRCQVFVSPHKDSRGGYDTDRCVECGTPWHQHMNIGPGWRARSEARKVQLGYMKNIVLGEN